MLALVSWTNPEGGAWEVGGNWSNGVGPGPNDDVVIDIVPSITVTHSTGTHTVQSLTINDPFTLSGGTLVVSGNLLQENANTFTITGGILRSAKVVGEDGAVLIASGGTLDAVTLGATVGGVAMAATLQGNGPFVVTGGLNFVNDSLLDLGVAMNLVGSLSGAGEVRFRGAYSAIHANGQTVLDPGLTIHRSDSGSSDITIANGGSVTNQGTIRADAGGQIRVFSNLGSALFTNVVGGVLAADGGTLNLATDWSNAGEIVVNDSSINLGGRFTTAGIGAIKRTGGTINLTGLFDNTGSTFVLDATTGSWEMPNGNAELRGGNLVTSGGAVLVAGSGTLNGVTLGGEIGGAPALATVRSTNIGGFRVTGGLTFSNGSLVDLGNGMTLDGDQTLGGLGEIRFRGNSGITNYHQTMFGPGLTIHRDDGNSSTINLVGGSITNRGLIRADLGGQIRVTGNPGTAFTNAVGGLWAADGGTLSLLSPWNNAGQIVVNNSTLNLGGSFTTAGLGEYTRTGGTINLVGLLDNTGNTFSLDATTGSWNLNSGFAELRGGNVVTTGGAALVFTLDNTSGTLNGVTLGGTVAGVPVSATVLGNSPSVFVVTGGLTFANGSLIDTHTGVQFVGDQMVGGDGEIRLRGPFAGLTIYNQTTFGPGLTIHSDADSATIFMVGGSITNQGTIRVDAGQLGLIGNAGTTFTNATGGLLSAAGGKLRIDTTTNYADGTLTGGSWQAIGNSTLQITGADITTNAATIVLDGAGARINRNNAPTSALTNLATNAALGSLRLRNGASFSTLGAFANNGSLTVGSASTFTANGTFTQGTDALLAVEIGGTPDSGQFGRLLTTGTAALNGRLDVRLSNGYGPDPVLSFPIMNFDNRTGDFAAINGLTIGGLAIFDAVYDATHLTLTSLALPADPAFVSANPPATISPGQPTAVPYTVQNRTGTPAAGNWFDSLYLSTDGVLDPSDVLLGRVEHQGGLAGNASYSETLTAIVPAIAEGNYRVIVLTDSRHLVPQGNRTNDVGASSATTAVTVPVLTLGALFSGTIANGQDLYFRLDVPAGRDVRIAADFETSLSVEFVTRYATLPDRTTFDQAAPNLFDPHPQLLLITPQAGRHYVLLHGREGSGAGQPFKIQADYPPLNLSTISPNHGSNVGQATTKLKGSGFTSSTAVSLLAGATTRVASSIQFVDSSTLFATFDLRGLTPGTYDVQIVESAQSDLSAGAYIVSSRAPSKIRTFISSPGAIRPERTNPVRIDYVNDGDTDLPAPLLELNGQNALLRLPGEPAFRVDSMHVLGINHEGPVAILPPGYHGTITVEFRSVTSGDRDPYRFDLRVLDLPEESINWADFKSEIRPLGVQDDAWDVIFANLTARAGNTLEQYQAMLGRTATYLSQLGETTADVSRLMGFELLKADALFPVESLAATEDLFAPTPGLPLSFNRVFLQRISGRYRLGTLGRGWSYNWDASASADALGHVTILTPAGVRFFLKQFNGTYAGLPEETAVLTRPGGSYQLRESDGTVLAFRPDGLPDFVEDANGNRNTAGYTGTLLTSIAHSSGAALTLTYNAQGRIGQVTTSDGEVATYAYSGEHLTSVTTSDGTTQYSYETGQGSAREHALASVTYPDGARTVFEYDDQGRMNRTFIDTLSGSPATLRYAYGANEELTVSDADGAAATYLFDDRGNVAKVIDPLTRVALFKSDTAGRLVRASAPGQGAVSYTYDSRGNLTRAVDSLGNHIDLAYDPLFSRLHRFQDARGNITVNSLDARGNFVLTTYPDGTTETYVHDAQGNVTRYVNRNGQAIDYSYDTRGRVTRKDLPDGTHTDYTYDAHGELLTATDSRGAIMMEYDAAHRVTKITYPGGRSLAFTYDAAGRRTRSVDQIGFATNYRYDDAGRLVESTDGLAQRIVAYQYDPLGRLVREDRGNGTASTYEYDLAGQLLHLVHRAPDNSVSGRFDYTYDALGRVRSMTTLAGTATYDYDVIGQLTSLSLPGGRIIAYQYDAMGNRVSVTDNGIAESYTTNNLNAYTSVGAATLLYDLAGNLISRTEAGVTTNYAYDAEGRLVSVVGPSGTWTYEYDALGNRVALVHDGLRTEYLVDPLGLSDVVAEYNDAGLVAHYTHGFGLTSRVDATGAAAFYNYDASGNTSALTDASGAVANSYSYLPFGESLSALEAIANPFEFVGQFGVMEDAEDLHFMRARFYAAEDGRFTQPDPIGIAGGINLYAYVNNNPASSVDPSGTYLLYAITGGISLGLFIGGVYSLFFTGDEGKDVDRSYEGPQDKTPKLPDQGPAKPPSSPAPSGPAPSGPPPSGPPPSGPKPPGPKPPGPAPSGPKPRGPKPRGPKPGGPGGSGPKPGGPRPGGPGPGGGGCHCGPGGPGPGGGSGGAIRTSSDPNDIVGPAGFGADHFVVQDATLDYTIHFENKAAATAPAQEVVITEQLDPDLDFTSFELGDFGFGATTVDVPDGRSVFSTRVDARATVGLFVDFNAEINLSSGLVTWTFRSIDPTTLDLPFDALAGFLPPNDAAHSGEGFVSYHVRAKTGLATGTEIRSVALIVFDTNAPIATNQINPDDPSQGADPNKEALVTIDAGSSASSVAPLAALQNATFTIDWTGADDTSGSGVRAFDVFVSDNDSEFTLFSNDTAATSATFAGLAGHSYRFYTVATDNVGHAELPPATFDALTTITTHPWHNAPMPLDVDQNGLIAPLDAILVINYLNARLPREVPATAATGGGPGFIDTSGNDLVTPLDAIIVINSLNAARRVDGENELQPTFGDNTLAAFDAVMTQLLPGYSFDGHSRRIPDPAVAAPRRYEPISFPSQTDIPVWHLAVPDLPISRKVAKPIPAYIDDELLELLAEHLLLLSAMR